MTNQFIQYNDLNNEILYQKCKPVTDIKRAEIQNIMTEMCEKITSKLDSVAAVIFQHEFNHPLGSVYVDFDTKSMDKKSYKLNLLVVSLKLIKNVMKRVPLLLEKYQIGKNI